jgi:hypothetical protein
MVFDMMSSSWAKRELVRWGREKLLCVEMWGLYWQVLNSTYSEYAVKYDQDRLIVITGSHKSRDIPDKI